MYMNICTVGMEVVGIFRRTPATATIKAMKEQFNQGMIVSTHTHTHTQVYMYMYMYLSVIKVNGTLI